MELKIAVHGKEAEYYWDQVRGANITVSSPHIAEIVTTDVSIRVKRCDIDCLDVELRVFIFDVTDESSFCAAEEVRAAYTDCDVVAAAWHESNVESSGCETRWVIIPCKFAEGRAVAMHWAEDSWRPLVTKLRAKYPSLWSIDIQEAVWEYLDGMYWG